mmetsp:Transcript_21048/g.46382  ORF Transcript_21048/g.46382 Transcript_21048/m.46382 type:complete len:204 (+) Transcript_21048:63-674(+)
MPTHTHTHIQQTHTRAMSSMTALLRDNSELRPHKLHLVPKATRSTEPTETEVAELEADGGFTSTFPVALPISWLLHSIKEDAERLRLEVWGESPGELRFELGLEHLIEELTMLPTVLDDNFCGTASTHINAQVPIVGKCLSQVLSNPSVELRCLSLLGCLGTQQHECLLLRLPLSTLTQTRLFGFPLLLLQHNALGLSDIPHR